MMKRLACIVLITPMAATAYGQGAIQKCVGADGKIHYQDAPCDAKQKTAAQIQRDKTAADAAAIKRAQEERERSDGYAKARAKDAAEEARRESARAKEIAEAEARADARAAPQPTNIYLQPQPQPIVVRPLPLPALPAKK